MATLPPEDLKTRLMLYVSLQNIPKLDILSATDASIEVYLSSSNGGFVSLCKTEIVHNDLNPTFTTGIQVEYQFEKVQTLRFDVFDQDGKSKSSKFASFSTPISDIITSPHGVLKAPLPLTISNSAKPTIIIRSEELPRPKREIPEEEDDSPLQIQENHWQFSGSDLDRKDGPFRKSDPYYILFKIMADGSKQKLYQSEWIKQDLNPTWKPHILNLDNLCAGDVKRQIEVEVWDYDSTSDHDFIGSFKARVEELKTGAKFELINPKKAAKKKSYKNSGVFKVEDASVTFYEKPRIVVRKPARFQWPHSFVEYLNHGLEISMIVGIDYTSSNGSPSISSSYHYQSSVDPTTGLAPKNRYEAALTAVGEVVIPYDSDNMIPAYAYGAMYKSQTKFSIPLNLDYEAPELHGLDELLTTYRKSFSYFSLSSPTNMAPLIEATVAKVKRSIVNNPSPRTNPYTVLVILTDGDISDRSETKKAIVEASFLPISILIVAVCQGSFSFMEELDSDNELLKYGGKEAMRDIVQFVPFLDHDKDGSFAEAALAELPGQVLDYMASTKTIPSEFSSANIQTVSISAATPAFAPL